MPFRLDIQGLRALAVLAVFFFHLDHRIMPGGFIGVDIFFVVSGFLISGILLKNKEKNEFSFLKFYQSRFKRILPAYYVLLVVVAIATIFIYLNQDIKVFRKTLLWSSLFNSNNYFATLDTYFGAKNSENPLLHTWTLAVEMQFYFILPLFIWLFRKSKFIWITAIILISSIIYTHFQISLKKEIVGMYYSLFARSSEFLIGVLFQIFILYKTKEINKKSQNLLAFVALPLIIIPIFVYNESTLFPGIMAIIPCIGTGMLLITKDSLINRFLSNKTFVFIGQLSYSIYLWHWPFMALHRYYYSQYEIPVGHAIILSILIFISSYISYYFVEEIWRKKSNKLFWMTSISTLGLIAVLILTSVTINEKTGTLDPVFSTSKVMGFDSHGKYFKELEVLGNKSAQDTIFMLGDSHGLVMKPFINYIGSRNNFAVTTLTNDTYAPIPNVNEKEFRENSTYTLYQSVSKIAAKEIEKRKIILVVKSWGRDLPYLNGGLVQLIRNNPEKKFIILEDFPSLDKNPIRVNRGIIRNKSISDTIEVSKRKIPEKWAKIFNELPNATILDLTEVELFDDIPYYNDTVFYYDQDHLNKFGSEKYGKLAEKRFMETFRTL